MAPVTASARRVPALTHWDVKTGHHVEQRAGNMAGRANAAATHIDLAAIGPGISDEFREGLYRQRRVDDHDQCRPLDAGDRRDVAREAEIEIVVERLVDRARRAGQQKRITVRRRMCHEAGADVGPGAATVLDDDLLVETL